MLYGASNQRAFFLVLLCLWAAVHKPQLNTKCLSEMVAGQRPESSTSSSCVVLYQATKIHRATNCNPKSSTITIEHCVSCTAISLHYIHPQTAEWNHNLLLIGHHRLVAQTKSHLYRNQRHIKTANQSMPRLKIELKHKWNIPECCSDSHKISRWC